MWTISNWIPGALRRACDPQLAPSRRGDRVSVRARVPIAKLSHALSWWLTNTINHHRQERNRYLSTDQPPPKQPHEADHCSAGAGSAGQSKQRAGSGAG
jgi:hypothetical protein